MRYLLFAIAALFLCGISIAPAQSRPASRSSSRPSDGKTSDAEPAPDKDHLVVSTHEITLHGKPLKYESTAGTISIKDDAGKPRANFFFIAYRVIADPANDVTKRPITFVFNGGPGSASVWLHLGTVGPMRVNNSDEGQPSAPPHKLVENQETWLDATDLVFIDPVGTGFSRAAEGINPKEFWGVDQDISSVANFIRLYLTRYERWSSPKFLAGESYGTTRAAGLSLYLADTYGIDLNGIVLISSVLNFQAIESTAGNDLPYALFLPTYTALAGFHHKLPPDLQANPEQARIAAQQWANGEYLTALAKGKNLTAAEQTAVATKLSQFTSLPVDFILKSHLRIDAEAFRKKLLNDQDQIIGRYDGRMTAPDPIPARDRLSEDPSDSLYYPVYASAFNDYIRRDLKYESDAPYRVLASVQPWDSGDNDGFIDVSARLRAAMMQNPHLKVLVAAGYYDLATPFASVDYTIGHIDLGQQISDRITQAYFPSGHMIYHHGPSRQKLREDVGTFISGAVPN